MRVFVYPGLEPLITLFKQSQKPSLLIELSRWNISYWKSVAGLAIQKHDKQTQLLKQCHRNWFILRKLFNQNQISH
jgi:hypothetical protein